MNAAFATALSLSNSISREADAVAAIAEAVIRGGGNRLWVPKVCHGALANAVCTTCWKGAKTYDLGWASTPSATSPTELLQFKMGFKAQKDQEVLLFLGDVAFAALDRRPGAVAVRCVTLLPANGPVAYWDRLASPATSLWTLVLDPANAANKIARGESWIDPENGVISPITRSQYNKIFGAGTNAKFIGLFRRPGKLEIECEASTLPAGRYRLLVFQIAQVKLSGTAQQLEEWWP